MKELIRRELIHRGFNYSDADFIAEIDRTGGWPVGYKFVSFFHSSQNRYCKFGNVDLREPYWTTVMSSDDYHSSKISKEGKKKIEREAMEKAARIINQRILNEE